jgi:hypothetical protein
LIVTGFIDRDDALAGRNHRLRDLLELFDTMTDSIFQMKALSRWPCHGAWDRFGARIICQSASNVAEFVIDTLRRPRRLTRSLTVPTSPRD